jgi:hypothetical protein
MYRGHGHVDALVGPLPQAPLGRRGPANTEAEARSTKTGGPNAIIHMSVLDNQIEYGALPSRVQAAHIDTHTWHPCQAVSPDLFGHGLLSPPLATASSANTVRLGALATACQGGHHNTSPWKSKCLAGVRAPRCCIRNSAFFSAPPAVYQACRRALWAAYRARQWPTDK